MAVLTDVPPVRSWTRSDHLWSAVSERLEAVSGRNAETVGHGGLAQPSLGSFMGDGASGWPTRLVGFLMAGVWLVFLSDAFTQAWRQRETVRGDSGLMVLLAFAVLYLLHFTHLRAAVWGSRGPIPTRWYVTRTGVFAWAGLALLAAFAVVFVGQEGASTWVFLAVSGLWTFRVPIGLGVGVALVALYEFLTFHLNGWDHNASISMSIVLAMAAVTGGMLASQRQRALGEAREVNARLAIQEERNRMARDVHDILGHSLTVITVKAELASRLLEVSPERARAEVEDLERLARDALADVRQAVAGFRDMSLPAELARARSSLAAAGIEPELPTAADEVQTRLREVCAWALREGVTNVIRHSGASSCRVTLGPNGITIADNGTGPQPGTPGTGLLGLKERAAAVGAVLHTRTLQPHGFELSLTTGDAPPGSRGLSQQRVQA
jgi:two-component system, NarL family, sensor histidine kinase DesK